MRNFPENTETPNSGGASDRQSSSDLTSPEYIPQQLVEPTPETKTEISVLLVEDDEAYIKEFKKAVEEINLRSTIPVSIVVETETTLQKALYHLDEFFVDVVFLDLTLPDALGVKGIQQISRMFPGIPIISLMQVSSWQTSIDSTNAGSHDSLLKQETSPEAILGLAYHAYEQKQYHDRITESQETYRSLVDHLPEGVFRTDVEGRINFVNRTFASLVEQSPEWLIGKTQQDLFTPESHSVLDRITRQAIRDRRWTTTEMELTTITGKKVIAEVIHGPIINAENEITGIQGVLRDNEEHQNLIQKQRISDRFEGVETIAKEVVHKVSECLTPINLNATLIGDRTKDPLIKNLTEAIIEATTRSGKILRQIAALTHEATAEATEIDIELLMTHIERRARQLLPPGIHLSMHHSAQLPMVKGDFQRLIEMLELLITNAIEAMGTTGTLTISAHLGEAPAFIDDSQREENLAPTVIIRVEDTGPGIKKGTEIFDPYFTTKASEKHNGTGLSNCVALSRQLGVDLRLDKKYTEGAAFEVIMTAEKVQTRPAETHKQQGSGKRILLVDDEETLLKTECIFLESQGYRVQTASNGAQALNHVLDQSSKLDLVITDMSMPYMDGGALVRAIHEHNPLLPVLVTTGTNKLNNALDREQLGVKAVLQKPFAPRRLLEKVSEALRQN